MKTWEQNGGRIELLLAEFRENDWVEREAGEVA